jgi:hypothetical protein
MESFGLGVVCMPVILVFRKEAEVGL